VALIDTKGCAKVNQKISGTFQKPVVEKLNILVALAGPALKLLKKGSSVLYRSLQALTTALFI
jgi:hypothetical protein